MSLTFGSAGTERVTVGASGDAAFANTDPLSFLLWAKVTTLTDSRWFFCQGNTPLSPTRRGYGLFLTGTGGNVRFRRCTGTGSTSIDATTTTTPMAGAGWVCIAGSCDCNATPVINLYTGTLTTILGSGVTAGVGPVTPFTGGNIFTIGNASQANNAAIQGSIATFMFWNRVLSLGELKQQQFNPHMNDANLLIYMQLGFNGASSQPNYQGGGKAGTVTGATQSAHVPLRAPFCAIGGNRALYPAQTITPKKWAIANGGVVVG